MYFPVWPCSEKILILLLLIKKIHNLIRWIFLTACFWWVLFENTVFKRLWVFSLRHFAVLLSWPLLYFPPRLLVAVSFPSFVLARLLCTPFFALMLIFWSYFFCVFPAFILSFFSPPFSPPFLRCSFFPLVLRLLPSARLNQRLQLLRLGWDSIFVQHRPSAL